MKRNLPPLNSLRALEAAARHNSFKLAADELNVTPAAISHQIRLLEDVVGRKLFLRTAGGLELHGSFDSAVQMLTAAFDLLERSYAGLSSDPRSCALTVSVPTSFAARWLIPRLDELQETRPSLQLRVEANDRVVELHIGDIDFAVRFGLGDYHDLVTERLFSADFVPVCAPEFLANQGPAHSASELVRYPLLQRVNDAENITHPSWKMWFRAAGVPDPGPVTGLQLNSSSLLIDAAVAGRGIALVAMSLIEQELRDGVLVSALSNAAPVAQQFSYYLVYPSREHLCDDALAFRDWILAAARRTSIGDGGGAET